MKILSALVVTLIASTVLASIDGDGTAEFRVNSDESLLKIYGGAAEAIFNRLDVKVETSVGENSDEWLKKQYRIGDFYNCLKTQQKDQKSDPWGEPAYKCVITLGENEDGKLDGTIWRVK